jgi:type IV/VI secretion system ImpK/VasF family protein
MQDEVASLAHPVITYALKIKDRLDRGEDVTPARSHAELERLLTPTAGSRTTFAKEDDVRYALACWVDELFILHSPWRQRWNETKLEFQLFRSNERAVRFWEKANRALAAGDVALVEVFLLCTALGFRGGMADNPVGLTQWTEAARRLIEVELGRAWINPPSREPHIHVPPLSASERFSKTAMRIGLLAMLVIPLAVFFLMMQLAD